MILLASDETKWPDPTPPDTDPDEDLNEDDSGVAESETEEAPE